MLHLHCNLQSLSSLTSQPRLSNYSACLPSSPSLQQQQLCHPARTCAVSCCASQGKYASSTSTTHGPRLSLSRCTQCWCSSSLICRQHLRRSHARSLTHPAAAQTTCSSYRASPRSSKPCYPHGDAADHTHIRCKPDMLRPLVSKCWGLRKLVGPASQHMHCSTQLASDVACRTACRLQPCTRRLACTVAFPAAGHTQQQPGLAGYSG